MRRPPRQRKYESKCGDVRVRGTVNQIEDRYRSMARETDDRILAENFTQHAEHYNRIGAERW